MTRTRTRYAPLAAMALLATLGLLASQAAAALAADDTAMSEPMAVDPIEGLPWQLQEQAVDGVMAPVADGVLVTLLIGGGSAGGSGGCNSYFASYTLDGEALAFSGIGSTKMACPSPADDVESAYFANLESVATWSSDGGAMTLVDVDGNAVLRFAPAVAPVPVDGIEGLTWQLREQATDGAMVPVPEGVLVTLVMEGGDAGGSGGCNTYFASYVLDGASLTFSEIGSTLMFCEGPGGDVETVYFGNLALVASWASDGGTLTLSDADGNALLAYEAAAIGGIEGGWVAAGINNGAEAVVTSETTPQVTAIFDADGGLRGFDGCNDYSTTYTLDGDHISISDAIVTTRMACASDALAEQSNQYFAALLAATTWAVDPSGRLELRDDSGALQVMYSPAVG